MVFAGRNKTGKRENYCQKNDSLCVVSNDYFDNSGDMSVCEYFVSLSITWTDSSDYERTLLSGVFVGDSGMVFHIVVAFGTNGVNDRSCDCGSFDFILEKKLYSDDVLCNTDFGCADCFKTTWI